MRTIVALARCSHFAPTVAVTAFATLLAVAAGQGLRAVWVAAAVLAGQLSVGWSNDWLDAERDTRADRRDKPIVRGDIGAAVVRRAALAALPVAAGLSLASGTTAAVVHMTAVALAWAYNLGLKSTVLSPLPYTAAFGLLPAFVTLGLAPPAWPPAWAAAAAALLGAGAHFTNTLPDLDDDAATGVRGLPHRLGAGVSLGLATVLLAGGAAAVAFGPPGPPRPGQTAALALSLAGVVGVVASGATGRTHLAFPAALLTAASVVIAFLGAGARLTS